MKAVFSDQDFESINYILHRDNRSFCMLAIYYSFFYVIWQEVFKATPCFAVVVCQILVRYMILLLCLLEMYIVPCESLQLSCFQSFNFILWRICSLAHASLRFPAGKAKCWSHAITSRDKASHASEVRVKRMSGIMSKQTQTFLVSRLLGKGDKWPHNYMDHTGNQVMPAMGCALCANHQQPQSLVGRSLSLKSAPFSWKVLPCINHASLSLEVTTLHYHIPPFPWKRLPCIYHASFSLEDPTCIYHASLPLADTTLHLPCLSFPGRL